MNATDKMNMGVRMGLLAGVLYVGLTYTLYFKDPALLVSFWKTLPFMIVLMLLCFTAYLKRQALGGYLPYKEALRTVFITFLIAESMWQASQYVLFNYIDPNLSETLKALSVEQLDRMQETLPERQYEGMRKHLKQEDFSITPGVAMLGWAIWVIIGFLLSLIVAALFRRNPEDRENGQA